MNDFTFLTVGQIFGDQVYNLFGDDYARRLHGKQLEILKKYGVTAAITDFSILLGGAVSSENFTSEGKSGKDRTGFWWSSIYSIAPGPDSYSVSYDGGIEFPSITSCFTGARPAISYSSIYPFCHDITRLENGILEVDYGEYPQDIVVEDLSEILENRYLNGKINQTGKTYTTDSVVSNGFHYFCKRKHIEYEYKGEKYIRIPGDKNSCGRVLSDGRVIQEGKPYWVKVEPIKWMIDEKTDIALSKKIIFSGVQFSMDKPYPLRGPEYLMKQPRAYYFRESAIKRFMDKYFSKDIIDSRRIYINRRLEEVEDNINIRNDLISFVYRNLCFRLFDEINGSNDKDSFISCMDIVFDSDTYFEMSSKLNLLKEASLRYSEGSKKEALELIKDLNNDRHKEKFDGKNVCYPTSCMNKVEKTKKIIDRMKELYSRIDDSYDSEYFDSIHDGSSSLKEIISKNSRRKFGLDIKRKLKRFVSK